MIYLDYASTTPIRSEILDTYTNLLKTSYANSDSLHDMGRDAMKLMEQSRAKIAQLFNVQTKEIMFTSGASEANNYAIKGYAIANQRKGKHIIASSVEHSSVANSLEQLKTMFGFEITYLSINIDGCISLDDLKKELRKDTILVTCMMVNNEVGAINPIHEIASYVHEHSRAVLHCDCVQAIGKINVQFTDMDMATCSAHKIYGLKGSGFLYHKHNLEILPWISAGQQEFGMRGGTSNAPVHTVLAKTIRLAMEEQQIHDTYIKELNMYLRKQLMQINQVIINSSVYASSYILNISCMNVGSEIALNALNAKGIAISAQSTCASKSKARSHVLLAMGLGEHRATHAIRISLSHMTTKIELDTFINALKETINSYGTK